MKHTKLFLVLALSVLCIVGTAMTAGAVPATYPSYDVTAAMLAAPPAHGPANFSNGFTPITGWKGEAIQVYFNNGVTTFAIDPAKFEGGQYDHPLTGGGDDIAIAFINQGSQAVSSVTMTGSGSGGGLFAFDSDDNFGSSGITITNVNAGKTTGTVNFTSGLQPGTFAWWAFESDASSLQGSFVAGVPEPATMLLLGLGLVGLAGASRKFKK